MVGPMSELSLIQHNKQKEKSPSHALYLLSKSDFGTSSAKPGILGPSTIKPVYFWSLGCFGRWFSHDLAATRYMRSLNYEIYFILGPSIVLEGGFRIM
jgi:hypothetical protein